MFPWNEFFVIFGLAMFGAVAIIPYSIAFSGNQLAEVDMPLPVLMLLSMIQNAVLIALATGLGLLASHAIGLNAPIIEALLNGTALPELNFIPIAIIAGIIGTAAVILIEMLYFRPRIPDAFHTTEGHMPVWKRFLASFYGGITEEVLVRWFVMSGIAWLLSRIWQTEAGDPTLAVLWIANILAALLFGILHLPATARLAKLTPTLVVRAIMLNGLLGLILGYLFWTYGLEAAIIGHFTGDIVIHVFAPYFIGGKKEDTSTLETASEVG